jgi:hypothetical protein
VTDVITEVAIERSDVHDVVRLDELDEQLIGQLVDRARSQGLRLTGEDGLLAQLTKTIIESAAEGEMDAHLGYAKHDPAGRDGGNSRNGARTKTVLTDIGPVEVAIPRDRHGTFEPQIVRKRQRRLSGLDSLVISLSAARRLAGRLRLRGGVVDLLHHAFAVAAPRRADRHRDPVVLGDPGKRSGHPPAAGVADRGHPVEAPHPRDTAQSAGHAVEAGDQMRLVFRGRQGGSPLAGMR